MKKLIFCALLCLSSLGIYAQKDSTTFKGYIQNKEYDVYLKIGSTASIKLPAAKAEKLIKGGYAGKTVVMGIRPEDLSDEAEGATSDVVLDAKIEVYELLGAEVFLYFTVEGSNFTARVNPRTTARTGDTVKFALDVDKIHVFDKETELTITN